MDNITLTQNQIEQEHIAWNSILSHHLQFLAQSHITKSGEIYDRIIDLLADSMFESRVPLKARNQEMLLFSEAVRKLKIDILSKQLEGNMVTNLDPIFINQMINKVNEAISKLQEIETTGAITTISTVILT